MQLLYVWHSLSIRSSIIIVTEITPRCFFLSNILFKVFVYRKIRTGSNTVKKILHKKYEKRFKHYQKKSWTQELTQAKLQT